MVGLLLAEARFDPPYNCGIGLLSNALCVLLHARHFWSACSNTNR